MNVNSAEPAATGQAYEGTQPDGSKSRQFKEAVLVWLAFIVLVVLFNGTIPFALGADVRAWTASPLKSVLFGFVFYAGIFLAVPLVLIKGWSTVRRPGFLLPLCLAMLGLSFWHFFWPGVTAAVGVLAYLHWRFDLSGYGVRSKGWKGDLASILLMGILGLVPIFMQSTRLMIMPREALAAALTRLFANPASSFENLFYYGFLAERLSYKAGKWLTPLLIGIMYTAHEISNPEYWYGGMSFVLVFVGVALWTAIYLWRRNAVVIWLGDGLYRFVIALF